MEVIETYAGINDGGYFTNSVTEIFAKPGAKVRHAKLGFESAQALHLGKIGVRQERDSSVATLAFTIGGALVRNEVDPVLDGTGCEGVLNGLTILDDTQHVDNCTVIDHAQPNSESHELFKGIYLGKSRGVFSGTIIVRQDAQKTNAIQNNQSLLLSDEASIETKPQLKIWADDVKCTHGATVGQLDEDAMFYLRSRGIPLEAARNMLVHAFASDVLREETNESLRAYLETRLLQKLGVVEQ